MPGYRELSTIPPLDAEQREHAARVTARLREHIAMGQGWLSFADYMQIVLYEVGLGYYSAGATKLGHGGDFTTAPESSDLFARCIAVQVAQILCALPGEPADVLEIGGGSGRLAFTLLEELAELGALPRRYQILEISADLRDRARERLERLPQALAARVEWLERWPSAPLRGVVLANEVLDALPCERFVWRGGEVLELGVAISPQGQLVEAERPAGVQLERAVQAIRASLVEELPENYRSELCLRLPAWIAGISTALAAGAALFFDYGLPRSQYYLPERTDGTLVCHFRHRAHGDPLRHPGLQDISAWVDFTAVAEAALAAGLEVAGFATQAFFLLALGIEARVAASSPGREQLLVAGEARRLLLPGEMGEAFKAIALTKALDADLAGFSLQDLRASL